MKRKKVYVPDYDYERLEKLFEKIDKEMDGELIEKNKSFGRIIANYEIRRIGVPEYIHVEITSEYIHAWRSKYGALFGSAFHYFNSKGNFYTDETLYKKIKVR